MRPVNRLERIHVARLRPANDVVDVRAVHRGNRPTWATQGSVHVTCWIYRRATDASVESISRELTERGNGVPFVTSVGTRTDETLPA